MMPDLPDAAEALRREIASRADTIAALEARLRHERRCLEDADVRLDTIQAQISRRLRA